MAIDKQASRLWRRRIREVLNPNWDPIDGCPEDEYEGITVWPDLGERITNTVAR